MKNNLRALRLNRGWTQREAAAALGTTRSQYTKLEFGSRRLSGPWIDRAAAAYGIDPGEIVRGKPATPTRLGAVTIAGAVVWDHNPEGTPWHTGYLKIADGVLGPLFDGWHVGLSSRCLDRSSLDDGGLYVVRLDETYFFGRWISAASTGHLLRWNASPCFNIEVKRAFAVLELRPAIAP